MENNLGEKLNACKVSVGPFILEGCLRNLIEYSNDCYTLTEKGDKSLSSLTSSLDKFWEDNDNRNEVSSLFKSIPTNPYTEEQSLQLCLNSVINQETPNFWEWITSNRNKIANIVQKEGITFYTLFCELLIYLRKKE